jgi:hypothetical protein
MPQLLKTLARPAGLEVAKPQPSATTVAAATEPKRIGIVGSRRRNSDADYKALEDALAEVYVRGDSFVSGGCPLGGDAFAEQIAKAVGISITVHHPDWKVHGKAAGFVRNDKIARDCDVLLALVHPDRTGGTEDTVAKARKLGKKVILVLDGQEGPCVACGGTGTASNGQACVPCQARSGGG